MYLGLGSKHNSHLNKTGWLQLKFIWQSTRVCAHLYKVLYGVGQGCVKGVSGSSWNPESASCLNRFCVLGGDVAAAFYSRSQFLVLILCLLLGCTVLPPTRQIWGSEQKPVPASALKTRFQGRGKGPLLGKGRCETQSGTGRCCDQIKRMGESHTNIILAEKNLVSQ